MRQHPIGTARTLENAPFSPTPPPDEARKTEPEGPEADGKARARVIFEQAVAVHKDARYFDGVERLIETSRTYPDSKLCFNIARAYEGLNHPNKGTVSSSRPSYLAAGIMRFDSARCAVCA